MTGSAKRAENLEYRDLTPADMYDSLLTFFQRRQQVKRCWRMLEGQMQLVECPFIEDWDDAQRLEVLSALRGTLKQKGLVYGAFTEGKLKGFVSVSPAALGSRGQYLDMPMLHVSADMRGHGIGTVLLKHAKVWAHKKGARKLYISAHSSEESQLFYRAAGAVEAEEYDPIHTANEPFDLQMELELFEK